MPARRADAPGLVHADDGAPGLRRIRSGRGFRYVDARGRTVRDPATLRRIASLVIPPAWRDVWICPDACGHLQATGRDARGRKQYRYHPDWTRFRSQDKYARMLDFSRALPRLRRRTARDLARRGLPREKVLALVVRLLEITHARIGNEEYSRSNRSYGLTTLRDEHAVAAGGAVRLRFRGKSGVEHDLRVGDPRLARLVRRCRDLPGQQLLQYLGDDGEVHDVTSGDVNAYIKEVTGGDFTAKDFRTWSGTCLAASELAAPGASGRRRLVAVVKAVAARLGNTPATCRKHYIHPELFEAHEASEMEALARRPCPRGLRAVEGLVVAILTRPRRARGQDPPGRRAARSPGGRPPGGRARR